MDRLAAAFLGMNNEARENLVEFAEAQAVLHPRSDMEQDGSAANDGSVNRASSKPSVR